MRRHLVHFDPFRNRRRLFLNSWPFTNLDWDWDEVDGSVSVDMYETDKSVVVEADLPGVDPEDVDITVSDDNVTIKAEKKEEVEEKEKDYIRQERRFGSFSRTMSLPVQVIEDKAEAEFEDGTLKLVLPKAEPTEAKEVKVKVSGKKDK